MRASVIMLALVVGVGALAGCGTPKPDASQCSIVLPDVMKALSRKVTEPGTIRFARIVEKNGQRFISFEVHKRDQQRNQDGDILTFFEQGDQHFEAVDVLARQGSTWPHAPFDARHAGVVESRGCVDYARNYDSAPDSGS